MTTEIERRVKILDYLLTAKQNTKIKINKSDVMRQLEPISRLKTTHKTIVDLIDEGKIKMNKDNARSQVHYLTINEKNEFNKIYNELLEIENYIDNKMAPLVSTIHKLTREDKPEESKAGYLLDECFRIPFDYPFDQMLNFLIVTVTNSPDQFSPEDSEILYKKIVELRQKRASQLGHRDLEAKANYVLNNNIFTIEELVKKHQKDFQKYASMYNKYHLDLGLKDDLIQLMKHFQEEFLS